mmetsp:Transcript_18198/g.59988  ORF Transcript_18198/g.59988 Transcript_18198/m.59988 type:complete len:150 (-) Transcript_18198:283-732(-)
MQRDRLVGSLEEVVYQPGEDIITEGEVGTHFYLIVEGQVSVTKAGQEGVLARRSTGDYFGERALRTGEKTTATVSATGAKPVRLVRLDRWAYEHMLSPVDDLLPLCKYSSPPTAPPLAVHCPPKLGGVIDADGNSLSHSSHRALTHSRL